MQRKTWNRRKPSGLSAPIELIGVKRDEEFLEKVFPGFFGRLFRRPDEQSRPLALRKGGDSGGTGREACTAPDACLALSATDLGRHLGVPLRFPRFQESAFCSGSFFQPRTFHCAALRRFSLPSAQRLARAGSRYVDAPFCSLFQRRLGPECCPLAALGGKKLGEYWNHGTMECWMGRKREKAVQPKGMGLRGKASKDVKLTTWIFPIIPTFQYSNLPLPDRGMYHEAPHLPG